MVSIYKVYDNARGVPLALYTEKALAEEHIRRLVEERPEEYGHWRLGIQRELLQSVVKNDIETLTCDYVTG